MEKIFILGIVAMYALCACSPSKKGESLGNDYCSNLKDFENFTLPSQFYDMKKNAERAICDEYESLLIKYSADTLKKSEFITAYNKTVNENSVSFISAYENVVRTMLNAPQGWYRENDPHKYYLYSFLEDSLNILNCKDKIYYKLHVDTLFFADNDSTIAKIEFVDDTMLKIVNINDTNSFSIYRHANIKDLIVGTWYYYLYGKYNWTKYNENGTYSGQQWQDLYDDGYIYRRNTSGVYDVVQIDDSTYRLTLDKGQNGLDCKVIMTDVDKIKQNNWIEHRNKKGSPDKLSLLFENKKDNK